MHGCTGTKLLSTITDVAVSKIKATSTLDYYVGSIRVVIWGWPWVVFTIFGTWQNLFRHPR